MSIAHAEADAPLARELGAYLERNCAVEVQYARVADDLIEATGRALSADILILLLSPHSVPRRLAREEWEPLFLNPRADYATDVAFVQVSPCAFPPVLLRTNTFDARPDSLGCARALKRWIYQLRPPALRASLPSSGTTAASPELWRQLADQPATMTLADRDQARAFAEQAQEEFESVFWLDCRVSTMAEVAGEAGARMGLRLPGTARANLDGVRDLCTRHRCLLVLEGPSEEASAGFDRFGRSSVLIVRPAAPLPPVTLAAATGQLKALVSWMKDPAAPMPRSGEVRRTVEWLIDNEWDHAQFLSSAAVAYYKHHDRLAEAFELTEMMVRAAVERRDAQVAFDYGKERQWLLEGWGLNPELPHPLAPAPPPAEQMGLFS